MNSSNKPGNPPKRTFEGICAEYGLTLGDLSFLRDAVNQVLPGVLKDAGIAQDLTWEHILTLEGLGDKSVPKIMTNIADSKERPLPRLLFALGILHVGSEIAELLTQNHGDLESLSQASQEDLTQVAGIGPKIAESVVAYFNVDTNRQVIAKLAAAGVNPTQKPGETSQSEDLPFQGLTFVITGTLSAFSRREGESRIKTLGGGVTSSVTGKTDYLVAGESPGSKLKTAQRLETQVLDESEFLAMLEKASST